ncbi:MAG: TonB-dependent hemoglobin/transferrin/lactoferrin family receptor [Usitatibacter sp.]
MHTFLPLAALAAALNGSPDPQPMERIVVTAVASRVAQAADDTPSTTSVIDRDEIEGLLARDVRDALRYEPGVSVENGAARFGLGNIAIRGLEGNRVQMLYDGVRLPDGFRLGTFSNASRNPFDLALLSRIEVLRGPGSALYGSDALAGVVSMTTLDPGDLLRGAARAGGFADAAYGGADDSLHRTGAFAARSGAFDFLVGVARADGSERDNRGEVDTFGPTRTTPNPQDGSETSRLAKVAFNTADGGRWRATYDRFERRVATDVRSLNPQSARTVSLAGDDGAERTRASVDTVLRALGPIDRLSVIAYDQRSLTTQDTVDVRANTTAACLSAPGTVSCRREVRFRFEQKETGLTAIGQSAAGTSRHQLVYGIEWSRIRTDETRDGRQTNLGTGAVTNVVGTDIFPTRDFPRSRVERAGTFVQDEVAFGPATLVAALRYDRFDMRPESDAIYATSNPGRPAVATADDAWSPKVGALVPLGGAVTLALQASAGFRAPPYYDVNIGISNLPLGYSVIPNPDLKPEQSRGFEAALRGRHRWVDWTLTAYLTNYDDLIVSRAPLACPGNPLCVPTAPITFQSQNVTRARIEGIEARAEARLGGGFSAKLGASASRGDDRTRGVPLNSVDPARVVIGLAYTHALAGAELHVTHAARKTRIDTTAATYFAPPAYTIADITAFAKLGRNVTLRAGIFNLFDRKYWLWSDVRGVTNPGASAERYTQPGRSAGVQVKVEF